MRWIWASARDSNSKKQFAEQGYTTGFFKYSYLNSEKQVCVLLIKTNQITSSACYEDVAYPCRWQTMRALLQCTIVFIHLTTYIIIKYPFWAPWLKLFTSFIVSKLWISYYRHILFSLTSKYLIKQRKHSCMTHLSIKWDFLTSVYPSISLPIW